MPGPEWKLAGIATKPGYKGGKEGVNAPDGFKGYTMQPGFDKKGAPYVLKRIRQRKDAASSAMDYTI